MATSYVPTNFNDLGTPPSIDAAFLNDKLQAFLLAIAEGGSGSVCKADLALEADHATDADTATSAETAGDADTVAAAGVGSTAVPAMTGSADNYKTGGMFFCASTITNAPFPSDRDANVLVIPKDANNVTQFAMSVSGVNAIKQRRCVDGTWQAWGDIGGSASPPPIGMTYMQFAGKSTPGTLWPGTTWTDISQTDSLLKGRVPRIEGAATYGSAAAFGSVQEDAILPHQHNVYYNGDDHSAGALTAIQAGQTVYSGYIAITSTINARNAAEVRVASTTVRVWRRDS